MATVCNASRVDSGKFRNPNISPCVAPVQHVKPTATDDWLLGERPATWWTGKHPEECPGMSKQGVLQVIKHPNLDTCTRDELLDYFDNAWTLTEVLFASLQGEETFTRAPYHGLRHPMIFYYGHTACVYINKLRVAGLVKDPIDPYLEVILETGVDEMSWDDMSKNEMEWPPVANVTEYRRTAYKIIREVFETAQLPIKMDDPCWALAMGIAHEHIHMETSSVLLREMPLQFLRLPKYWPAIHPSALATQEAVAPKNDLIDVPAGQVNLGKPVDWPSFGWDNEYGSRSLSVPGFSASKFKITNAEMLEFIKADGYRTERYWSAEGWAWRLFRNAKWPTFWLPDGPAGLHKYKLRCLFEVVDLPMNWPVIVNFHEATAFAAWRSHRDQIPCRLLTEAETNLIRDKSGPEVTLADDPCMVAGGADSIEKCRANLQLAHGSEGPVDACKPGEKGFYDVFGNVWQWCEDPIFPYGGFKVHPLYDDFTVPCFDGRHRIILGGSFISAGDNGASAWSRFHFRAHFFQHAGFRLCVPSDPSALDRIRGSPNVFSAASAILDANLLSQFGEAEQLTALTGPALDLVRTGLALPQRCADILVSTMSSLALPKTRALVAQSCPAGAAATLSRSFDSVVALSPTLVASESVKTLLTTGHLEVHRTLEGELQQPVPLSIPKAGPGEVAVRHGEGACLGLDESSGLYQGAMVVDLLEESPAPKLLLSAVAARVAPGGLLLIAGSHDWGKAGGGQLG
eukprot:CAMPEP_0114548514 /NCGR_PEP_ID=MMETSP0114-20121206/5023_1 /TAXON_ID=31324 /ORGANISM="Goniomonas sp, Strain m" /LENGTH=742 /DNA_ID=CAMNT_0001733111 /DNA_START=40 /DNA_END=2264 /DNA_ORIENTATION=-